MSDHDSYSDSSSAEFFQGFFNRNFSPSDLFQDIEVWRGPLEIAIEGSCN
jgi:hypothetical protein